MEEVSAEYAGPVETWSVDLGKGIDRSGNEEFVVMILSRPTSRGEAESRTPAAYHRPLPKGFSIARERLEGLKAILDDSFTF